MLACVLAFDIEAVRIGENLRIAVGAGEVEDDCFPAPDSGARDVGVLGSDSGIELDR